MGGGQLESGGWAAGGWGMENDLVRTVRGRRSGEEVAELLWGLLDADHWKIPDDIAIIFPFILPGLSTISNAESSARILCKRTIQTVEQNLQDDVHFRKSRSSIRCQADEAGSTRKRNLLR